jgi:hydroxyacylglutathione hydrolase
MADEVKIINLWKNKTIRKFRNGVNCYLVKAGSRFILVDSGLPIHGKALLYELEKTGCTPGKLNLIIATHADLDHCGNCRYLQRIYGAPIAMHPLDAKVAETGDIFVNKKLIYGKKTKLFRSVYLLIFRFSRFTPDLLVEDGFDLSGYGLDAKILHTPGHSRGSISVLTAAANLFCGDLFINSYQPSLSKSTDDLPGLKNSFEKVKAMNIKTVYPGHGAPFAFQIVKDNISKNGRRI